MRIPELWKKGYAGKNVLVGHLDTGADPEHPALKTAIAHCAEFDYIGREISPPKSPIETLASTAPIRRQSLRGNRSEEDRQVGVAHEAKLASAIVIEGGNAVARVLGGMNWAVGKGVRKS